MATYTTNELLKGSYSQKETFLIDVIGYSQDDLQDKWEIQLDAMINDNWNTEEYLKYIA